MKDLQGRRALDRGSRPPPSHRSQRSERGGLGPPPPSPPDRSTRRPAREGRGTRRRGPTTSGPGARARSHLAATRSTRRRRRAVRRWRTRPCRDGGTPRPAGIEPFDPGRNGDLERRPPQVLDAEPPSRRRTPRSRGPDRRRPLRPTLAGRVADVDATLSARRRRKVVFGVLDLRGTVGVQDAHPHWSWSIPGLRPRRPPPPALRDRGSVRSTPGTRRRGRTRRSRARWPHALHRQGSLRCVESPRRGPGPPRSPCSTPDRVRAPATVSSVSMVRSRRGYRPSRSSRHG